MPGCKALIQLPFPVYVVPGNHDVKSALADGHSIALADFHYYRKFGYDNQSNYTCEVLPKVVNWAEFQLFLMNRATGRSSFR